MPSPLSREAVVESHRQAATLLALGIGIWLVATLAFQFLGEFLLPANDASRVALVFVLTVPAMAMLAFAAYSLLDVDPERRLTAAVLLVLPGMVLDAVAVTTLEPVLPALMSESGSLFGGLLLLAYAAILFTGVVPLSYVRSDDADADAEVNADTNESDAPTTAQSSATESPEPDAGHTNPPADARAQAPHDHHRDALTED